MGRVNAGSDKGGSLEKSFRVMDSTGTSFAALRMDRMLFRRDAAEDNAARGFAELPRVWIMGLLVTALIRNFKISSSGSLKYPGKATNMQRNIKTTCKRIEIETGKNNRFS